ncbi:MAG: hypothetical protein P4M09_29080 [Devosia sp.]|nr:hypothetical protein [Devosia sp.]
MQPNTQTTRRFDPAVIAGGIAIVANTLALRLADAIPLTTARGGLLRLLTQWLAAPAEWSGVAAFWAEHGLPGAQSALVQTGFHLLVGLAMALVYAYGIEPFGPGGSWRKGIAYALVVWLLNAAVVLPATGEGFAGSAHLALAGMLWFAGAHTLFFVLLAVVYDRLKRRSMS